MIFILPKNNEIFLLPRQKAVLRFNTQSLVSTLHHPCKTREIIFVLYFSLKKKRQISYNLFWPIQYNCYQSKSTIQCLYEYPTNGTVVSLTTYTFIFIYV